MKKENLIIDIKRTNAIKVFVRFMKHLLLISLILQNRYLEQYISQLTQNLLHSS